MWRVRPVPQLPSRRPMVGSGAGLFGGVLAAGVGHAAPSGQIPPPWAWWGNEAPATRAARRPVPGASPELAQVTEGGADRRVRQERGRAVESIAMTLAA